MIIDSLGEFADATALSTAGTGLALIGNVIDTGVARDLGNGEQVYLVIQVDTAVTSAGAATVQFEIVSDAQAAIATDGSATVHAMTNAIGKASLTAGVQVAVLPLPFNGIAPYERYVGVLQNVGTAALTAGKVNLFLTRTPSSWVSYSDGV